MDASDEPPTVPLDLFIGLLVGQVFALTVAPRLRAGDPAHYRRAFRRAVAFSGLVFWPIGVYLMAVYPAWSWMYFVDPAAHGVWLGYAATLLYPASGLAGFALARALVCAGRPRLALAGAVAAGLGFALLVALPWRRFASVGTFAEWTGGTAVPLLANGRWVRDMLIIGTIFNAAAAAVVVANVRVWRGARPQPAQVA